METVAISRADKRIIEDIVLHYPPGERTRALRAIFNHHANTNHYLYLGQVIGICDRTKPKPVHHFYNQFLN